MAISLLHVDDREMMRLGLSKLVEWTEIRIVAEAGSSSDAALLARKYRPDVVLLDLRIADRQGKHVLECIKQESPSSVVLISSNDLTPTHLSRAKALGAAGFLSKRSNRHEVLSTIRKAASGVNVWTDQQMQRLSGPLIRRRQDIHAEMPLTKRQSEVLRHIASGLTTKEIAKSLDIRYDTAKEHVQNTMRKIGVTGRTQAAVWAVRQGLV